jgi:hypothetical protein
VTDRSLEDRIRLRLAVESGASTEWVDEDDVPSDWWVRGSESGRIAALEAEDSWDPQGGHDGGQGTPLSDFLAGHRRPLVFAEPDGDAEAMRAVAEREAGRG